MTASRRGLSRIAVLLWCLQLLLACGGTAPRISTPSPTRPAPPTATPAPPTAPVSTPALDLTGALLLGLDEEPDTLYGPLSTTAAQRIVDYAIREPWVTSLGYRYQPNPRFLQGPLPQVENGGALLVPARAFVDASGALTTTDTGRLSETTQLIVTFAMQPGLRWSDGEPLTTRDVLFGHTVTCDPASGARSYELCELVERIEVVDPTTWRVVYHPGRRDPLYSARLANAVLPEHQLRDVLPGALAGDPRVAEHPLGWGPFMLEQGDWVRARWIVLSRNPHYAGAAAGRPRMPRLIIRFIADTTERWSALYAGELDLALIDGLEAELIQTIQLAAGDGKVRAELVESSFWEHLDFNLSDPKALASPSLLSDRLLRQAIAYGANRAAYAEALYGRPIAPLHSFVSPHSWLFADKGALSMYAYDPARANQLLDEAGYARGLDGIRSRDTRRLAFELLTTTDPARALVAGMLQADMLQLGIEITVSPLPATSLFGPEGRLARRNFELALFAWGGQAEPSAWPLYGCEMIPSLANGWSGYNSMGWCNERASDALRRAEIALARLERKQWYTMVQEEFTRDVPSLPLFPLLDVYPMAPDLQYVRPDPSEYVTWNVAEWEAPRGSR